MSGADELHEHLTASAAERMALRVRRLVDQIMEPEYRRVEEMLVKGGSFRRVEVDLPYTEADVTKRVLELMELAVTERVQEINWTPPELTPTTLRKVMQAMRPLKVMPMPDDQMKKWFLQIAMSDRQMLNHNAFVTVTVPQELHRETEDVYESSENAGCCDGGWGDDGRVCGQCAGV